MRDLRNLEKLSVHCAAVPKLLGGEVHIVVMGGKALSEMHMKLTKLIFPVYAETAARCRDNWVGPVEPSETPISLRQWTVHYLLRMSYFFDISRDDFDKDGFCEFPLRSSLSHRPPV